MQGAREVMKMNKNPLAAKLALAGACVAILFLAAQAQLGVAERGRDEFKFIYENQYENQGPVPGPAPTSPAPTSTASYTPSTTPYTPPSQVSPAPQPAAPPTPSKENKPENKPAPDFTVSVSPELQKILNKITVNSLESGKYVVKDVESYGSGAAAIKVQRSASFTVTVKSLNGFTGTVSLSVSGVSSGASYSLPSSVSVPKNGQAVAFLDITTTGSTSKGTYTLTVTGTAGGASRSDNAELVVEERTELEGRGTSIGPMVDDSYQVPLSSTTAKYIVPVGQPTITINGTTVANNGASKTLVGKIAAAGSEVKHILDQNVVKPAISAVNKVVQAVQIALNALKNLFRK